MRLLMLLMLALPLACSKPEAAAERATHEAPQELKVGSPAPDFTTEAHDASTFTLSALRGKQVVVYFYPKDDTPGCSLEAISFRDIHDQIQAANAVVVGISKDSLVSHSKFAAAHSLPFLLLSDSNGEIAGKYGVPGTLFPARQTIVIDKDGNVKKIYRTVDPRVHATEILNDLEAG